MDWHATLVDTHDAMYHAVDDVLPHLEELDLWDRLLDPDDSKTIEDAKLLMYVKDHHRLHPKIVAQRKISRTDIFEVLFGSDQEAKARAHQAFDSASKNTFRKSTRWNRTYADNSSAFVPSIFAQALSPTANGIFWSTNWRWSMVLAGKTCLTLWSVAAMWHAANPRQICCLKR